MTEFTTSVSVGLDMQPIMWDGCFGWFHSMPARQPGGIAAVICSGIGRDGSTGYRPTRFLADTLAEAGYPAFRFNYPGTGDSCDVSIGEVWAAWRRSLDSAIDKALSLSGADQVILFGIRLGGALAGLAASERREVAGLVLLEPVLRGSSYALQLKLEERIAVGDGPVEQETVRVHGLRLPRPLLDALSRVDLRSVAPRGDCKVLVLTDSSSAVLRDCVEFWSRGGAQVTHRSSGGMEAFFRPTHLADEPFPDLQPLMLWLRGSVPLRARSRPMLPETDKPYLRHPGYVETPHLFGAHRHLFGMMCQPDHPTPDGKMVIIGNTGGDPHQGFARFAVELARAMARHGIASFRIDFAGLGDSINAAGDRDGVTHTFDVDRRRDFADAIGFVEDLGFQFVALQGLCSGAYHAFEAASADRRVASVLCVNLPWFNLRHEKAGPASSARRGMADLRERRVRSLFLFASEDAGLKALQTHFGPLGQELAALPGCELAILPQLDHDLTRPEMRRLVIDRIVDFLEDRAGIDDGATAIAAALDGAGPGETALLQTLNS